ncbi:MurR/RpiR family transcriptional regulator [Mycoplasma buteonis]|uniref:MurR/RpiR family transcriptional regulator n=1 Tax=Mycoplasma buteonis TaxID=171280 RepID=UPI0005608931|nr:MurR/RpiR family transcriptional regulator [Mycoplasma buteonis]
MRPTLIETEKTEKIKESNENFKVLLDFIENHPEQFKNWNSSVLSRSLNISQPTITRFCKRLGFKNFRDLQIYVAERVSKISRVSRFLKEGEDLNSADIISNVFNLYNYSISETYNIYGMNQRKIVQYAKTVIEHYPNIIFGIGDSSNIARYFSQQLRKLGISIYALDSIHEFFSSEITLKAKTHVTLISSGLKTAEVLKIIEHLERMNITYSVWTSEVSRAEDLCKNARNILEIVGIEEEYRLVPTGLKVSSFMLVDIIFGMIIYSHKEKANKYKIMRDNIANWNEQMTCDNLKDSIKQLEVLKSRKKNQS